MVRRLVGKRTQLLPSFENEVVRLARSGSLQETRLLTSTSSERVKAMYLKVLLIEVISITGRISTPVRKV